MSLASVYATKVDLDSAKIAATASTRPPGYSVVGFSADVTNTGGLHLNQEATLTAQQALDLGNWLIATFGL